MIHLSRLLDPHHLPGLPQDLEIAGLTADSRAVKPGYVFAALPGTKVDGGSFIPEALAKGAVAVIGVPHTLQGLSGALPLKDENPRKLLALMAAQFYGRQPGHIAAVTGTNGKTSVASFARQIWTYLGRRAASLGTLGVQGPDGNLPLAHTTPDPVTLHQALAGLADQGVDHLALEASSHGLDQYRLDGISIQAAALTNITRDHLDYHPDFEAYAGAKMRLFADLLPANGNAVVNADSPEAHRVATIAKARGLRLISVGKAGADLKLAGQQLLPGGQLLTLETPMGQRRITLPLAGSFQAGNALVAAALVTALGEDPDQVLAALEHLTVVPGRAELAARLNNGAGIFVDYAHTPDALETLLRALRPHATGRLVLVFGCGGDRDRGKRPQMGAIAAHLADITIVTDDNPRSEEPASIRAQILAACPGATEIGDRRAAIEHAVGLLGPGDILLIAGKGHEAGQIIGTVTHPFDDREEARRAAAGREKRHD